ncbi:hypothetical protein DM01DRAFT_1371407 [Hesseltinella vesiculosa]|uniref:Uncharacterized protein n=1 Tax=Hesseltinella vesiculosa TaxID=101127 RepID=A0A1X2GSF8_9FUNG|nr:hypothetical protein DM01DRAFT_1371407 [Hesseltinella vesiculosa]
MTTPPPINGPPEIPGYSNAVDHLRTMLDSLDSIPNAVVRAILRELLADYPMEPRLWVQAIHLESQEGKHDAANALLMKIGNSEFFPKW